MDHRNVAFERMATREAVPDIDVESLNAFAESRANTVGSLMPTLERDMLREVREELADARNYIVWRLLEIHRGRVDDDSAKWMRALMCVVLAWEALSS